MARTRLFVLIAAALALSACNGSEPIAEDRDLAHAEEEYRAFHGDESAQDEQPAPDAASDAAPPEPQPQAEPEPDVAAAEPAPPDEAPPAELEPEPVAAEPPPPPESVASEQAALLYALVDKPDADSAMSVLQDLVSTNVMAQVEAVRVLSALRPPRAQHELYVAAFTLPSTFVRERAMGSLLTAFPAGGTDWGPRLLATHGGRPSDRYEVARQVIANKTVASYQLALEVLAEDFSGQAMFDARDAILTAGDPIVVSLTRVALQRKGTPNAFVARRLYRWIQGAGRITEAYYDTFDNNPSEIGVKLFRERYGKAATPMLEKKLDSADDEMKQYIQDALAEIENPEAPPPTNLRRLRTPNILYLITYKTPDARRRILTDTPIWPNDEPGKIDRHIHGQTSVTQKTIGMKADQLAQLRTLKPTAVPSLRVDNETIDRLDMRPE